LFPVKFLQVRKKNGRKTGSRPKVLGGNAQKGSNARGVAKERLTWNLLQRNKNFGAAKRTFGAD
jgi:hypothetical protein